MAFEPITLKRGGNAVTARTQDEVGMLLSMGFAEASSYTYQHFPKAVHKAGGASKSVKDEDELKAAVKAGWKLKPVDAVAE